MMSKVLIVYGTAYGQTERITQRIAGALAAAGHTVSALRGDRLATDLSLGEYDAFVVTASVLFGRHQRYIRGFVRDHITRLNAAPSAFVSVCGAMAGSGLEGSSVAQGYVERFVRETGWRPSTVRSFAGGLPYSRYGPFVRLMMKLISRRTGRPTDTSRDYDLTDWEAVDRFGRELAKMFATYSTEAGAGATAS
jgi:menaquinone-dependent protoporphyrinogen oxidase